MLQLLHRSSFRTLVAAFACLALLLPGLKPGFAQAPPPDVPPPPAFTRQKLEQIASPIALYPDSLLTQVMMAATYPLDVVQAARWRRANPGLRGGALEAALERQPWDESVKAITAFPDVLRMMDERLQWTEELGEAFIADPNALMAAVQELRRRAQAAGHLRSSSQYRVQHYDAGPYGPGGYYVIEPVDPEVIFVPAYDPLIYGVWPYPDYPPYYWYPRRRDALIWFGTAVVVGAALWAAWDWNRRRVAINQRRFTAFNRGARPITAWRFNPDRRRGAPFRSPTLVNRFKGIPAAKGVAPGVIGGKRPPIGTRVPTAVPKATIAPRVIQPKGPAVQQRQIVRPPSAGAVRRTAPSRPVRTAPTVRRAAPINRPPAARPQVRVQRAAPAPRAGGGGGGNKGKKRN
jgi:hypothetical protein